MILCQQQALLELLLEVEERERRRAVAAAEVAVHFAPEMGCTGHLPHWQELRELNLDYLSAEVQKSSLVEVRIELHSISAHPGKRVFEGLTSHLRSIIIFITFILTWRFLLHPVSVQSVLPLPYLAEFLITVFVFLVNVWSTGVVNVVPILDDLTFFLVLLSPFSSTSLSFLHSVKAVYIVIVHRSPVGQSAFGRRFNCITEL